MVAQLLFLFAKKLVFAIVATVTIIKEIKQFQAIQFISPLFVFLRIFACALSII